jgi:hypothetical protein
VSGSREPDCDGWDFDGFDEAGFYDTPFAQRTSFLGWKISKMSKAWKSGVGKWRNRL